MRHDKQIINFANKEVVNYSAIANKAKSLSDGIRSIDFDRINDSITFNSSLVHNRPKIQIKPSNNSINNVSETNFNDNSTLTGITSDSSNTDPTKAISTAIMIDVNNRIENLESKTQNQTATANETTFTGNVQADKFNGYYLKQVGNYHKLPEIVVINERSVVEIGRNLDFHDSTSTSVDYNGRISYKQNYFHCSDKFVVENGKDIQAANIISSKGNLNNIIDRTVALETKNTEQDTRLDNIETKNTEQDTQLTNIETNNTEQDTRLDALESKTQNQTASANETTFTGNVQADTFNGYKLGMNDRFYNIPSIPVINNDLVMEVGRYIDFHYNASTNKDYTSRLSITQPGNLHFDHSFILDKGSDFRARNLISDNGDLNNIIDRTVALETNNTEQDTRLTNIESKNTEQDTRLNTIETKNTEQDTRLDTLEISTIPAITSRVDDLESSDQAQNLALISIETNNTKQDERLDELEKYKLSVTYKAGSVTPNISYEFAPELSEELTDVFNMKINITFEEKTYFPTFAAGNNKLLYFEIKYYEIIDGTQYINIAGNTISAINENGNVTFSFNNKHYTVNNVIIEKGKILFDLSYKSPNYDEPSMWHGWFSVTSIKYYSSAVLTQPTINEYFISKNLAYDNEERLSAATNKNNEQDTRLGTLESNQITLTMINNEHITYNISGTPSFADNIFTFVFDEQPTTGTIIFDGDFFDGNNNRICQFTIYFSNGAYSKTEIKYVDQYFTDVFRGEYNSSTLTFKLFGNNGLQTLNSFDESTLSINMPNEKVIATRTQDTKSLNILSDDLTDNNVYSASKLLDIIYPVGSIYMSMNNIDPSALFGGTWRQIDDNRFLLCSSTSMQTGGSTKIKIENMPLHSHTFHGNEITGAMNHVVRHYTDNNDKFEVNGCFSKSSLTGSMTWRGADGNGARIGVRFNATPTGTISATGSGKDYWQPYMSVFCWYRVT